ncbi:MAG: hypothetical protein KDK64_04455 [Chlamydiia bacterium]|nr:hypothetical protein [Chlamydiia bacterium]
MSIISFSDSKTVIEPAAFIGIAFLAGYTRLIQYFPNATKEGLLLTGGMVGAACCIHDYIFDGEKAIFLRKLAAIAAATVVSGYITWSFKESVALSFSNHLRLMVAGSAVSLMKHLLEKPIRPQAQVFEQEKEFFSPELMKQDLGEVLRLLRKLKYQGFFYSKSHESAKHYFAEILKKLGMSVDFVTAKGWDYQETVKELDCSMFHWSITQGVQNDIPHVSKDSSRVHLFSVASQYNASEAPSPFTPQVGEAMSKSEGDNTQGPLAQRTNPIMFELVTAFLTNLGFNMMEKVFPSAGKTFLPTSSIEHGYLRPTNANVGQFAEEMELSFDQIELPCYESHLQEGAHPIFLILGAAPALGYSPGLARGSTDCQKLQYYAYQALFSAQFNQVRTLLERYPDKDIVFHVTGTGLGVFKCDPKIFSNAFQKVAYTFQESLAAEDRARVHVQLESHRGSDELVQVAQSLKLGPAKPRIESLD